MPYQHYKTNMTVIKQEVPASPIHDKAALKRTGSGCKHRTLMRPWLIQQAISRKGVEFYHGNRTLIKIPWKHASSQSWRRNTDAGIFQLWAQHTGKYSEHEAEPKRWKANFRCAINSLPDVKEEKGLSEKRGPNAYKVYRLLPEKRQRRKRNNNTPYDYPKTSCTSHQNEDTNSVSDVPEYSCQMMFDAKAASMDYDNNDAVETRGSLSSASPEPQEYHHPQQKIPPPPYPTNGFLPVPQIYCDSPMTTTCSFSVQSRGIFTGANVSVCNTTSSSVFTPESNIQTVPVTNSNTNTAQIPDLSISNAIYEAQNTDVSAIDSYVHEGASNFASELDSCSEEELSSDCDSGFGDNCLEYLRLHEYSG